MIRFAVHENIASADVTIGCGPASEAVFQFQFNWYGDKHAAGLLVESANKKFANTVVDIRREEYERGYRDGRQHRQKSDYFQPTFRRLY